MSSVSSVEEVVAGAKRYVGFAAIFSAFINILALSSSLFMLQVYDRVLPSKSIPTLQSLFVLVCLLYAFSAALEIVRSKIFARLGLYFDARLGKAVFRLHIESGLPSTSDRSSLPFTDMAHVRGFLASGGPAAIFDLPWMPLYVALLFLLNPWLGACGILGIIVLCTLTWLSDRDTKAHQKLALKSSNEANDLAESCRRAAETIVPQGMISPLEQLWSEKNSHAASAILRNADALNVYGSASRFFRTTLQSLVLAVGATLVIYGDASGGVMIASSILLGRALAPIEQAIAQWKGFVNARQSLLRLKEQLGNTVTEQKTPLPLPTQRIDVTGLYVVAPQNPSKPLISDVNFSLEAGDALGVIGPSGSGKSTLARTLVGAWPPFRGEMRFDGATPNQWTDEDFGRFCGYLPQAVELFNGTIGQNISRFQKDAPASKVLSAAATAGLEPLIRSFPEGYDSPVGRYGGLLSAGQRQRIGLARALFSDPFMVVLDEPNSALDSEGEMALGQAILKIRERGGVAIVFVHRISVLQSVNKILVLSEGQQKAFGDRDEILRKLAGAQGRSSGTDQSHTRAKTR